MHAAALTCEVRKNPSCIWFNQILHVWQARCTNAFLVDEVQVMHQIFKSDFTNEELEGEMKRFLAERKMK